MADVPKDPFLAKLDEAISSHRWKRKVDANLHQSLVIGSALAGFAALTLGLMAQDHKEYAVWAGAIGALTSVATILSQQLHCVRAVNWHDRMLVEYEIIRNKFEFKFKSTPTDKQLDELVNDVARLKLKMVDAWARVTSSGPPAMGRIRAPEGLG
jgi:hypothetical protein